MARRLATILSVTIIGCTGVLGAVGEAPDPPGSRAPSETSEATDAAAPAAPACGLPPRRLWRLTPAQYDATLREAIRFGSTDVDPRAVLENALGPTTERFDNDAEERALPEGYVAQLFDTAHDVAAVYLKRNVPGTCLEDRKDRPLDVACVRGFVRDFGAKVLRRPLVEAEVEELVALYDAAGPDRTRALTLLIDAMILDPEAVFRTELGDESNPQAAIPLRPFEIASALSYWLLDGPPDDELLASARDGRLARRDEVEAQVRRLLARPRALTGLRRFVLQWSRVDRPIDKDDRLFPGHARALGAMREELWLLFADALESGTSYDELLGAQVGYVDREGLRLGLHEVADTAIEGLARITPVEPRAAFLTAPIRMAAHAQFDHTDIVLRGRHVREDLLCDPIPPPPPDVAAIPPAPDGRTTQRERLAVHTKDPSCAACHDRIDPLGFALEAYDAIGRHRVVEKGESERPIDTSGVLRGVTVDGLHGDRPFSHAKELAALIARSREGRACVVKLASAYALGRTNAPADRCARTSFEEAFDAAGGRLVDLVVAIATSDAFLLRSHAGAR
jgi:hypothetical protein